MENDLRVCKVREVTDLDRRFTFEIFSPKWYVFYYLDFFLFCFEFCFWSRHILQADTQRECNYWIESLEKTINNALNNVNNDNEQLNCEQLSNSSNDAIDLNDLSSNSINNNNNNNTFFLKPDSSINDSINQDSIFSKLSISRHQRTSSQKY